MRKLLLLVFSLFGGAACSPVPSDTYYDYRSRLANTLDTEVSALAPLSNKMLPRLDKPTATQNISILELASLSHCKINLLIANHNNQLGKTSPPSGKLAYSIRFIQQAGDCINHPDTPKELAYKLRLAASEKLQQLPLWFTYMLYNEPELAMLGKASFKELPVENTKLAQDTTEAISALSQLAVSLAHPEKIDAGEINTILEGLRGQYVQALLSSAQKQTNLNLATTELLSNFDIEQQLCPPKQNKTKAQILSNIFSKFYLQQIQPYQALLNGQLETLITQWQPISDLLAQQGIEQPISPQQTLTALKQSAKHHVQWWQKFYKTCNLSPL
ncbi:DUF3080 family protein [Pseudoalteromonas sp. T1lg65]|uniref:DUF3080 family protein n=1 Tax=Pseudoalteromonas sp. T1lg65 TaxID=2077101 RepID=UPI003F7998BA